MTSGKKVKEIRGACLSVNLMLLPLLVQLLTEGVKVYVGEVYTDDLYALAQMVFALTFIHSV